MGTVFNKKELLVLLQDFHCLTGLRSAVFDSYGIEVLAYPPELPAYCRLIRSVPDGKTGCYLCDQAAGSDRWCCCGFFAVEPHCTGGR